MQTFGNVTRVQRDRKTLNGFNVETRVRVGSMELTLDQFQCLPHLVGFRCGQQALLSEPGRPPPPLPQGPDEKAERVDVAKEVESTKKPVDEEKDLQD
ncbi:hypothetical protein MAR_009237 [Mya arenaria]|uniref:Uncharacterized protein n=1 Tax=Mya arenaria TaxID=6604 RepID=A0ABY7E097_MYAAR|nr:hypothetical protein MAR_009237 [Mya arenaria]